METTIIGLLYSYIMGLITADSLDVLMARILTSCG